MQFNSFSFHFRFSANNRKYNVIKFDNAPSVYYLDWESWMDLLYYYD